MTFNVDQAPQMTEAQALAAARSANDGLGQTFASLNKAMEQEHFLPVTATIPVLTLWHLHVTVEALAEHLERRVLADAAPAAFEEPKRG